MEGPSAVLNVLTIPSGATSTQARIVIDGVRGAIFVYKDGGPHGALIGSWAKSAGTDLYANPYPQGFSISSGMISAVQISTLPNGAPLITLIPPGGIAIAQSPFIEGEVVNAGLASERLEVMLNSGWENAPGPNSAAQIALTSRPNNSSGPSLASITADNIQGVRADGNAYPMGQLTLQATATPAAPQTIAQIAATTINGCGPVTVVPGTYEFEAELQFAGNQAAGTANFQVGLSGAAASIQWGNMEFHDAVAGTSGYVARPQSLGTFTSPTLSVNNWMASLRGQLTITTGGTMSLQAFCSVAADTFKILNGKFKLIPNF